MKEVCLILILILITLSLMAIAVRVDKYHEDLCFSIDAMSNSMRRAIKERPIVVMVEGEDSDRLTWLMDKLRLNRAIEFAWDGKSYKFPGGYSRTANELYAEHIASATEIVCYPTGTDIGTLFVPEGVDLQEDAILELLAPFSADAATPDTEKQ